jgi:hypothetical protein
MKTKYMLFIVVMTIFMSKILIAQSTDVNNIHNANYYLGYSSTTFNLDFGFNIPTNNQLMRLKPNGNFGIGNNWDPQYRLDVYDGDINVGDANGLNSFSIYRLGTLPILWHNGITTRLYVGIGAGNNNATGIYNTCIGGTAGLQLTSGDSNTYVGYRAGTSNTIESEETFIGYQAGMHTFSGPGNTFVGSNTGHNNLFGRGNVFMGVEAGYHNLGIFGSTDVACWNTFVGNFCGQDNINGNGNAFYGKHAGAENQNGDHNVEIGNHSGELSISHALNTFIGYHSGRSNGLAYEEYQADTNVFSGAFSGEYNYGDGNCFYGSAAGMHNSGNYNVYIGHRSQMGASGYTNSIAIGAFTNVTASNTMILGDNDVNVGIGLSGLTPAPQNKLEINSDPSNSPTWTGLGQSGLRFRQLTSAGPYNSPNGYSLTVDGNGDVILAPNAGSFGLSCTDYNNGLFYNLTDDWRLGLDNHTFYFAGQHVGNKSNVVLVMMAI